VKHFLKKYVNIWQSYRQEGWLSHKQFVRLGTVLLKDEEFAIDFMYDMKKLLFTFVILVRRYLQCFDTVGWAAGRASGL